MVCSFWCHCSKKWSSMPCVEQQQREPKSQSCICIWRGEVGTQQRSRVQFSGVCASGGMARAAGQHALAAAHRAVALADAIGAHDVQNAHAANSAYIGGLLGRSTGCMAICRPTLHATLLDTAPAQDKCRAMQPLCGPEARGICSRVLTECRLRCRRRGAARPAPAEQTGGTAGPARCVPAASWAAVCRRCKRAGCLEEQRSEASCMSTSCACLSSAAGPPADCC